MGFFSSAPEVLEESTRIWPWLCALTMLDGVFGCMLGILRALGRQMQQGIVVVVFLWGCGGPFILWASFDEDGGLGGGSALGSMW